MGKKQVFIIGGGAAGMMAAIYARRRGADVTIMERNPRVGKKILATGNGRCNFHQYPYRVDCYSGNDPHFASQALQNFDIDKTIRFFEKLGIAHKKWRKQARFISHVRSGFKYSGCIFIRTESKVV